MYKLTLYSLKISPKITPDLNMGQKLRSINIHEKKLIRTLDHDAALFCILTMRCLKIEVRINATKAIMKQDLSLFLTLSSI